MAKRKSSTKFEIDDRAYPIRVKLVVPEGGMQTIEGKRDVWLNDTLGPEAWSWGPAHSSACRQATAYYFRKLTDAQRFIDAFPGLELADGVDRLGYPKVKGPDYQGHAIGGGWTRTGEGS